MPDLYTSPGWTSPYSALYGGFQRGTGPTPSYGLPFGYPMEAQSPQDAVKAFGGGEEQTDDAWSELVPPAVKNFLEKEKVRRNQRRQAWAENPSDPRGRYDREQEQIESNRGFYKGTVPMTFQDYLARENWKLDTPGRHGPMRTLEHLPQDRYSYWKGRGSRMTPEREAEIVERLRAANEAETLRASRYR